MLSPRLNVYVSTGSTCRGSTGGMAKTCGRRLSSRIWNFSIPWTSAYFAWACTLNPPCTQHHGRLLLLNKKPYAIAAPKLNDSECPGKRPHYWHAIKALGNSHMRVEMHTHFLNIGLAMQMETPFLNLGLRTPQGDGWKMTSVLMQRRKEV